MGWEDTIVPIGTKDKDEKPKSWEDTIVPLDSPSSWEDTIVPIDSPSAGFLGKASSILTSGLEAAGDLGTKVATDPLGTLETIGNFGSNVAESTPRVLGNAAKEVATGLAQLPLDIASVDDTVTSKVYDILGLERAAANLRKSRDNKQQLNTSLAKAIDTIAPEAIQDNSLSPTERTAADITAVIGSGVTGGLMGPAKAAKALPSLYARFPTLAKTLASGTGAAIAESAATGSTNETDPLFLGDKDTNRVVKNRLLSPLEGFGIGAALEGGVKGIRALPGAKDSLVSKVAELMENRKAKPSDITKESPEAAEAAKEVLVTNYRADGLTKEAAEAKANQELMAMAVTEEPKFGEVLPPEGSKDIASFSSIDPTFDKGRIVTIGGVEINTDRTFSQVYDKLHQMRNIEKQLFDIKDPYKLRESTPMTQDIQIALQREPRVAEIVATLGIPKQVDGGLDLLTKADIGRQGNAPVLSMEGLANLSTKLKAPLDEVAKGLQYERIRKDYDIMEADTIDKDSDLIKARNRVVRAEENLKLSEGTVPSIEARDASLKELYEARKELKAAEAMKPRRVDIGLPIEEVDAYLKDFRAKPYYKELKEEFSSFFDGTLHWLKEAQLIDDVQLENLKNFYQGDYFPAFRKETTVDNTKGFTKGSTSYGKGIKEAKGGSEAYADPLESFVSYSAKVSSSAQRNIVLNKMADLFEKLPEDAWSKLFNTSKDDYYKQVLGTEGNLERLKGVTKEAGDASAEDLGKELDTVVYKEGTMTFYRNGRKVALSVKDRDLAATLDSLVPKANGLIMKGLNNIAKAQREVITITPVFALRNAWRDAQTIAATSQTGLKPYNVHYEGIRRMIQEPEEYAAFLRDMGTGPERYGIQRAKSEKDIARVISKFKGDYKTHGFLSIPFTKAHDKLVKLNEVLENAPRFAERQRTIDAGGSRGLGATRGSEATVNFGVRGNSKVVQDANQIALFLNANLQGQQRDARLLFSPKSVAKKAFKYVTIPALLLYAHNITWEHYDDIPSVIRHTNWIIPYGDDPNDYFKLPFDHIVSPFAAGIPMAILDDMRQGTNGSEFAQQLVTAIKPLTSVVNAVPPVFQSLFNVAVNRDDFTGAPIVTARDERKPDAEQYTERTSDTYKALGQATGMSPVKLEYLGKKNFSWINDLATGGLDPLVRMALGEAEVEKPKKSLGETPIIGPLFGSKTTESLASVYNMAANMEQELKTLSMSKMNPSELDASQRARVEKFLSEDPNKVDYLSYLKETMDNIGKISGDMRKVTTDPDMTSEEKTKELDKLREDRDLAAKDFLDSVRENPDLRKFYGQKYVGSIGIVPGIASVTVGAPRKSLSSKSLSEFRDKIESELSKFKPKPKQ